MTHTHKLIHHLYALRDSQQQSSRTFFIMSYRRWCWLSAYNMTHHKHSLLEPLDLLCLCQPRIAIRLSLV